MNTKTILILAVVVLGLFFGRKILQQTETHPPTAEDQFITVLPGSLTIATVQRVDFTVGKGEKPAVSLAKKNGEWVIASAWDAPAATANIEKYIKLLTGLRGEKRSDDPTQYSAYGVDDEKALHVRLYTDGTQSAFDLMIGRTPKGGYGKSFIRRANQTNVYLVREDLRNSIDMFGDEPPKHDRWLDKSFLKIDKDKITEISLTYPDHALTFSRQEKETKSAADKPTKKDKDGNEIKAEAATDALKEYIWTLKKGKAGDAKFNADSVQSILDAVADLKINDVADPTKRKEYGLDRPAYVFSATLEDGKVVKFVAARVRGEPEPYVELATKTKIAYRMSDHDFRAVFRPGSGFFALKRPPLVADDMLTLTYKRGAETVRLSRKDKDADWIIMPNDSGFPLKQRVIKDAADKLANWTIEDYADPGAQVKYGFAEPRCTVTIGSVKGATQTLMLGRDHPALKASYIATDPKKLVLSLSESDQKAAFPTLGEMLDLSSLTAMKSSEVEQVEITRRDEKPFTLQQKKSKDGKSTTWVLRVDGKESPAVTTKVTDMLTHLLALGAVDILPSADAPKALAKETVETIVLQTKKERLTIEFGALVGESRRAARFSSRRSAVQVAKADAAKSLAAPSQYLKVVKPATPKATPGDALRVIETIKNPLQR